MARRVLQVRRTACKMEGMEAKFKEILYKYAKKHSVGDRWPDWYHHVVQVDAEGIQAPRRFPLEQPHPTTNQHEAGWKDQIEPMGPIGLLIEAAVRNGLLIDQELRIWQQNEEPIDVLRTPYQGLKVAIKATAARARTSA